METDAGTPVPEKTDVDDQRSQKCHKITNFFPLLKPDGKNAPMNTLAQSSLATCSASNVPTDMPFRDRSPVSDAVYTDEECMGILKAPISQILRSKMGPSKDSLSQVADQVKSLSVQGCGSQNVGGVEMRDIDENESTRAHFRNDVPEEVEYSLNISKSNTGLVSPEAERDLHSVYKARKRGTTYSAKTFTSTSTSAALKTLGKDQSDINPRPDSSSQPGREQQDSPLPSQNCPGSSGSASSSQAEARSSSAVSITEKPSQNVPMKKQKKRHFKGGTYNLYLSPYRRKKNKKKNSDTASSMKDDESSIAGTENGSVIDSEGDNSIYSEDYYSPSEKSLLGDEPASPGKAESYSGLEMQKNKDASNSQMLSNKEHSASFNAAENHSEAESVNVLSQSSLSGLLNRKSPTMTYRDVPQQDVGELTIMKLRTGFHDAFLAEYGPYKKKLEGLSPEEREKARELFITAPVIPVNADNGKCEENTMPTLVKHEFPKNASDDTNQHRNTSIKVETTTPEIIKLMPVSSPSQDMELSPPSVVPDIELPSGGQSDTELPSSVPESELPSESVYTHGMASGTNGDNAVSTIAKSVKSRQRIKRRFTDDIVDTDAGILSLNSMPNLKKAKEQLSVSPRAEMKIGQGSRVECVVDMKLPPVASCTCEGSSLKPKSRTSPYVVYCQAVDSFYENRLGCCNPVTDLRLVRPSVKNPFVFMCRMHLWRLKSHHSCPVCGLFCSEGQFLACQGPEGKSCETHYFHESCMHTTVGKKLCLHCANAQNIRSTYLEFHSPVPPAFSHKQIREKTRARMSVVPYKERMEKPDPKKSFVIPETGKVLSGVGLSKYADRLQFESFLASLTTEKELAPKYSILDMHSAAASGDVPKVLYMMALGFDPNYRFANQENETALHAAAATGHLLIIHLLIQAGAISDPVNDRLYTPLMLAVENQHEDIIEYLITAGAHLQPRGDDGMTCLHLAAKAGNAGMCRVLLSARLLNINMQDDGGWTPLVWATEHKHLDIVKLLMANGADPNITDNEGNIGLHWSAFSGSLDICQIFLDHGCDVNAVNEHGDTPLHIAARQGYYECVHILLIRQANPFVVNKAGKTPIDCVARQESDVYLAIHINMALKKVVSKFTHRSEKVIHNDISKGKERNPIQCVNAVDDEEAPFDYYYVLANCETSQINFDRTTTTLMSCVCDRPCFSGGCNCGYISFKCWYDKDGCLVPEFNFLDPPLLFECNRKCKCWANCGNRVIQKGISCRLQLFRTEGKGWGVRTLKDIPKGAFICEYVGELITDSEADKREEDSYLFDLDYKDGDTFCLDAHFYGNISRFINHLCEPNIVPVKFFVDHQDLRYPRIAFFAFREIAANEELGFDYGEKFWSIKYKSFTCHCNSSKCKYSKDTITETLANYNRRLKEEAG